MKRKDAIELLKLAGYHEDSSAFTRVYLDSNLSRNAADAAYNLGYELKEGGMPCTCAKCIEKPLYTTEDYTLENKSFGGSKIGHNFTIPRGTRVTRRCADGSHDKDYAFVADLSWIDEDNGLLKHDASHYGINVQGKVELTTINLNVQPR